MDTFDWDEDDLSDFTTDEQEEIRQGREEMRRMLADPGSAPDLDPEHAERMWREICRRMGWDKPLT